MLKLQPLRILKSLFGYQPGREPKQTPSSVPTPNTIGVYGEDQMGSGYNWYQEQMALAQDRLERYRELRNMDDDDVISAAADLYAEDATTVNLDTGKSIWVTSENEQVLQLLEELFEAIEIEDILFPISRELGLMGDHFEAVIQSKGDSGLPGGVIKLVACDPASVHRHKDKLGRLVGFSRGEMPLPDGDLNKQEMCAPWEYLHWRLLGKRRDIDYGWSFFAPARRVYRRLRMMEDALVLYRIRRAPDRFVFKIKGTQSLSPEEKFRFMTALRTYMRKKMAMDKDGNQIRSELNPLSIDEDLYIDSEVIDVDRLSGSTNVGHILDIDYMRKRLCGCLRIPPDYLGFPEAKGGFVSRSTLAEQDIQFSRQVRRLQRSVITGFIRLCQLHLAWMGIDPLHERNEFEVHMNPVSYLDELQRTELMRVRVEVINAMEGLGKKFPNLDQMAWQRYLFRITGFPEDLIKQTDEMGQSLGLSGNVAITDSSEEGKALKNAVKSDNRMGRVLRETMDDLMFRSSLSSSSIRPEVRLERIFEGAVNRASVIVEETGEPYGGGREPKVVVPPGVSMGSV